MSSLTAVEKKYFEDMFGMSSGYVLDFTNNTFSTFFRETVGLDIYATKYEFNGDSKAKRLRAFWEIEPDSIVGKVLSEMLEVWKYQSSQNSSAPKDIRYDKCQDIIQRLLGKVHREENADKRFLEKDFGNISVDKIPIDSSLIPILKSRLEEAHRCF